MPTGDQVSAMASIAVAANLIYQPADGVEVIILNAGSAVTNISGTRYEPKADFYFYDGVLSCFIAVVNAREQWWTKLRVCITNTNYVRLVNRDVAIAVIHMTGVQIK